MRFRCRNMREFREHGMSGRNRGKNKQKMLPGLPGANGHSDEPRGFIVLGNPETVKFPQAVNQLRGPHQGTSASFVPLLGRGAEVGEEPKKSPPEPRLARAGSERGRMRKSQGQADPRLSAADGGLRRCRARCRRSGPASMARAPRQRLRRASRCSAADSWPKETWPDRNSIRALCPPN